LNGGNYALRDVVVDSNGSSYVLIAASLLNSTTAPSADVTNWALFASIGVSGVSGQTGVSGISGISGLIGSSGVSGLIGPSGVSGEIGLPGLSGISGISGLAGVSGISGISGLTGTDYFSVQGVSDTARSVSHIITLNSGVSNTTVTGATLDGVMVPIGTSCSVFSISMTLGTLPGGSSPTSDWIFSLVKQTRAQLQNSGNDGTDTAICSIAGDDTVGTCSNTNVTVSFAAGDLVALKAENTGTPAASRMYYSIRCSAP
jgi:hypothetical protein